MDFFRSPNLERAVEIIKSMLTFQDVEGTPFQRGLFTLGNLIILVGLFFIVRTCPNSKEVSDKIRTFNYSGVVISFIFILALLFLSRKSEFLYFQF